jgi:hypothetical protein
MLYGAFKGPRAKIWGHTWLLPSLEPHILGLGLTMGLYPHIKHTLQIIPIKKNNLFMYTKMFEIVPNCCQL